MAAPMALTSTTIGSPSTTTNQTIAALLGNESLLLTTPRMHAEGASKFSGVKKELREKLKPVELQTLKNNAEQGLEYKFKIIGAIMNITSK